MPSWLHELFSELFLNRPTLAAELLALKAVDLGPPSEAVVGAGDLTALVPTSYYADRTILLKRDDRVVSAIVVEIQLRPDRRKRYTWLYYIAALMARHQCPAYALVLTPDAGVARWANRALELGPFGSRWCPVVVGPADIPRVVSVTEAAERPELALLSLEVHGRTDPEVARAALNAAQSLGADRRFLYTDFIMSRVDEAVRDYLEASMLSDYFPQSDFFKRILAEQVEQGIQQGIQQGRHEALREALTELLRERSLEPTEDELVQIRACRDEPTLKAWLRAAATASSVAGALEARPG